MTGRLECPNPLCFRISPSWLCCPDTALGCDKGMVAFVRAPCEAWQICSTDCSHHRLRRLDGANGFLAKHLLD